MNLTNTFRSGKSPTAFWALDFLGLFLVYSSKSQSKRDKLEDPIPISKDEQRQFNTRYLKALQDKMPGVDLYGDLRKSQRLFHEKFLEVDSN